MINIKKGLIAEKIFIAHALSKNFNVFCPILDNGIDFIIEKNNYFKKIQLKASFKKENDRNGYKVKTTRSATGFYNDKIDFFIVLIYDQNIFYIIPVQEIYNKYSIRIYPHKECKYFKYKEKWNSLETLPIS